jgi:protein arginine kinase activator
MGILCQRCNQSPATVHLTDVLPSGEKRERHLCEDCAQEEGLMLKPQEGITSILEKFVKHGATVQETANLTCPDCGITWREFRSQGLLGCPRDYEVFGELLRPLIERVHEGANEHAGKVPASSGTGVKRQAQLVNLRRELADAVEREDYEAAAKLRDDIKAIENGEH